MEEFILSDEELLSWHLGRLESRRAIAKEAQKKLVGWLKTQNASPIGYLVLEPVDWQRLLREVGDGK